VSLAAREKIGVGFARKKKKRPGQMNPAIPGD
jgi:hypothetical protein